MLVNMEKFSSEYWNTLYLKNMTGWDIGYASTPIKDYIDQLTNKDLKILVPGAGNAYEVEHLFRLGFKSTFLLDFSEQSILNFRSRCPDFPSDQIIQKDFFDYQGSFDLILEQTFFSSVPRKMRNLYVQKIFELLNKGGNLIGLLFSHEFGFEGPPYGGTKAEYEQLFTPYFNIEKMSTAYNSIQPREERELFIKLRKIRN